MAERKDRNKAIAISWQDLLNADNNAELCLSLTQRQLKAIIPQLEYLRWKTRYTGNIVQIDEARALADEIEYRLVSALECAGMDCEDVLNCIDENIDEVTQKIVNNNIFRQSTEKIVEQTLEKFISEIIEALPPSPSQPCEDALYSGCLAIVERLHNDTLDMLEVYEVQTNVIDLLGAVSSVTGLDELSIDAIIEYVGFVQETTLEMYNAQWSDELRDELVCALFCRAKENCTFTLEDVLDVYIDRFGTISVLDVLQFFAGLVLGLGSGGEKLALGLHIGVLGFARFMALSPMAIFGDSSLKRLRLAIAIGMKDPSNAWALLCDCLPNEWIYEWNLLASDGGFALYQNFGQAPSGVWVLNEGWRGGGANNNLLSVLKVLPACRPNRMEVTINQIASRSSINDIIGVANKNVGNSPPFINDYAVNVSSNTQGIRTVGFDLSPIVDLTRLYIYSSSNSTFNFRVQKVRLRGTGVRPAFTGGAYIQ